MSTSNGIENMTMSNDVQPIELTATSFNNWGTGVEFITSDGDVYLGFDLSDDIIVMGQTYTLDDVSYIQVGLDYQYFFSVESFTYVYNRTDEGVSAVANFELNGVAYQFNYNLVFQNVEINVVQVEETPSYGGYRYSLNDGNQQTLTPLK